MSVYIKGMEMPKSCFECRFSIDGFCYAVGDVNIRANEERQIASCCPLVPVPPHGRLIDADALLENMKKVHDKWKMGEHYTPTSDDEIMVMYMPTIIPADKEGER